MSYREIIEKLCEAGANPGKTLMATKKETGKELVGVFPIHTPDEIVYAAGCVPIGMWGARRRSSWQTSICRASAVPSCVPMWNSP